MAVVVALRTAALDVRWMVEHAPGTDDVDVLDLATEESRVLVTLDKDFATCCSVMGAPRRLGWCSSGAGRRD